MAETCIVCLGDLNNGDPEPSPSSEAALEDNAPTASALNGNNGKRIAHPVEMNTEMIARILPCGHNLHNECLKPWVERANSCPICRASFNMVELHEILGGPVIEQYAVQDKVQQADIDPALIIDDDDLFGEEEEEEFEPCMVCGHYGDDEKLLICDGCGKTCHTHCADLDSVPAGNFFCYECRGDPTILNNSRSRPSSRRTTARTRAPRTGRRTNAWERVWMSVYQRLDFDIDFPWDDEELREEQRRQEQRERELQDERRFFRERYRVAERLGAANRFRPVASPARREQPAEKPREESQEELRAWNAFDKARAIQEGTTPERSNRRKRKSPTASPASPRPEPSERPLKRPRMRQPQEAPKLAEAPAEASTARRTPVQHPSVRRPAVRHSALPRREPREPAHDLGTSNFLQSLLKEVEVAPATSPGISDTNEYTGFAHERSSSPEAAPSPDASSVNPSRAHTPPPTHQHQRQQSPRATSPRATSPAPLTISIMPVYQGAPKPLHSPGPTTPKPGDLSDDERMRSRQRQGRKSPANSPSSSRHASPTRPQLSFSTKSEIQRMVTIALKPRYMSKEIDKDQYTDINREISRSMYEKVGDAAGLADQDKRDELQKAAEEEVEKAIAGLRTKIEEVDGAS